MTGARMPAGADAVVMQEKTRRLDERHVELLEAPTPGQFIRRRGEDLREGELLFAAGRELSAADPGALWGQGLTEVTVHRRPRVNIVTSGDELRPLGSTDRDAIIDTNGPVLQALATSAGAVATHVGRASDTPESLRVHFERGLEAEVLITVAGASVGERDFTREALLSLGVELDFWKLAMRPGKPLMFGRRGDTLVFGLPGNPVSAMVTFELFVRPALRALQGLSTALETLPGRAAAPMKPAPGLRLFTRATYEHRDGALWATPVGMQSSSALSSAFAAHALVDLAPDSPTITPGDAITLIPLRWTNR
jgi:molybdopterin molybdotransferase